MSHLLIIFTNSFDPYQSRQCIGPNMDPNSLTLIFYISIFSFFEKVDFEKKTDANEFFFF